MNIIILLPLLAFAFLLSVNMELLTREETINLFGAAEVDIKIFLFTVIFIIVYLILIFFLYDGINYALKYRINKLEEENTTLKAKLYDWQKKLLEDISKENHQLLEKFQKENIENLEKHQKDTDKILDRLNLVDKKILDKVKSWKNNLINK